MTNSSFDNSAALDAVHSLYELSLSRKSLNDQLTECLKLLVALPWLSTKHRGCLYLTNSNTRTLSLVASVGIDAILKAQYEQISYDECAGSEVIETGKISFIDSKDSDNNCPGHCSDNNHAIPLKYESTVLGVLTIQISNSREIAPHLQEFLLRAANIIGKLIHRHKGDQRNQQLSAIIHETPKFILECDLDGKMLYGNPALEKLLRQHCVDLENAIPQLHNEIVKTCFNTDTNNVADRNVKGRVISWFYHPVPPQGRIHLYGEDITDRRRAEHQLVHNAMHDFLTGLPNEAILTDRILSSMSVLKRNDNYRFALLLLNLDHFKTITESLGYSAGDKVLKKIANRIVRTTGEETTVSRTGGDEFVILIENIKNTDAATSLAKAIQKNVQLPMDLGSHRISVSASVGIVIGASDYTHPEELLKNAAAAVQQGKAKGQGACVLFDEQMHQSAIIKMRTKAELSNAISNGEITLFYQPVFSLKNLRLRGFEALARWNHPTRGLVGPQDFIPLAEETGLIVPLGDYVLKTACNQLQTWRKKRFPLAWVSVNLSTHQFGLSDLVPRITRMILKSGIDPHYLTIEITEGTAAASPKRAVKMMQELKETGIKISLDDFGTGYSSMSYLKHFPIDAIKIDRSFITDLPDNQDDAAIATTITKMSHSLGLKVIAEGIENERQALFLRSLGCDEVQGFLYAKPMPAEQATNLLKESNRRVSSVK